MIYNLLDDRIENWMLKSKVWKYELQFKQKKENKKQDSAYIKHREEWKRKKEEEQTRETEGAKRENNRKEERNKEEAKEKNKKKEEALLYESPRRKPGWRFTAGFTYWCRVHSSE